MHSFWFSGFGGEFGNGLTPIALERIAHYDPVSGPTAIPA